MIMPFSIYTRSHHLHQREALRHHPLLWLTSLKVRLIRFSVTV
jgi:hypothetical protein